ncbi:hypothetical protein HK104_009921 [Borealophlyctis nickersoniae]|nr:hypothetical protein HK104_009921 [Borealophlyctis nickersoniae]
MKFLISALVCSAALTGVNAHIEEVKLDGLWAGKPIVEITRDGRVPCSSFEGMGVQKADEAVEYGSWARTRATNRNLCFQVYKRGVTDKDGNPWKDVDVRINYRFKKENATDGNVFVWTYAPKWVRREGNNAVYAVALDEFDPFYYPKCIDKSIVTCGKDASGQQVHQARFEYDFMIDLPPRDPTTGHLLFGGWNGPNIVPFTVNFVDYPRSEEPQGCEKPDVCKA